MATSDRGGMDFEAAVGRLMENYAAASEIRSTAALAETVLAEGMRIGDAVRRRTRRPGGSPPDAAEVSSVERLADRLAEALAAARAGPEVSALARAVAAGRVEESARLAALIFADLEPAEAPAELFFPLPIRRRQRDLGEVLPEPEALAAEIRDVVARGVAAAASRRGLPEPIVLAPSWDAAGAELALRLAGGALRGCLRHRASNDVWIFAERLGGPFTVCLARRADDEWWAASALPFERYAARLVEVLVDAGVTVARMA